MQNFEMVREVPSNLEASVEKEFSSEAEVMAHFQGERENLLKEILKKAHENI